ncbi:MAG: monofunctional biosynthetic peptidoglycan transglycosylase [Bacteroidota bacterium]
MKAEVTDSAEGDFNAGKKASDPKPHRSLITRFWKQSVACAILLWFGIELLTLPFADIQNLRSHNPVETEFMRLHAQRAREEHRSFRKVQEWVRLSNVAPTAINAIVVAEDGRFWNHGGFDWFEFKESLLKNITQGRAARGASTITQQLIKNLYLSPSKHPLRKIREWILTWWMERTLTKNRILELYLNVIELGDGMYGVQAASRKYFGKLVSELTREEAARLAAIIPSPRRYRPDESSLYVERKSVVILQRMKARGM